MKTSASIRPGELSNLTAISALAREIWWLHYPEILSRAQIAYMLDRMYSLDQLRQDVEKDGVKYFAAWLGERMAGFAAVGPTDITSEFKLHKLYVHPQFQGNGLGKGLLEAAMKCAQHHRATSLILSVNKRNHRALGAYRAWGFQTRDEVCVDIGGGFVMDDYILYRNLG